VDIAVDGRLVVAHERHDGVAFSADRLRLDGCVPGRGRADKPVRQHPDLELLDPWRIGPDDDRLRLRLFTDDWLQPAAAWRVFALHPDTIDFGCWHPKVDRTRVGFVDELRPGRARAVRLAEDEVVARGRKFHRVQRVDAECFRRIRKDRLRVLCSRRADKRRQQRRECETADASNLHKTSCKREGASMRKAPSRPSRTRRDLRVYGLGAWKRPTYAALPTM